MVKGFIGGRGTGKTKKLIEYAEQTGATIVCADPERMVGKIHGYEKVGIPVISYLEFFEQAPTQNKLYVVDELDVLLSQLKITAFTFTEE